LVAPAFTRTTRRCRCLRRAMAERRSAGSGCMCAMIGPVVRTKRRWSGLPIHRIVAANIRSKHLANFTGVLQLRLYRACAVAKVSAAFRRGCEVRKSRGYQLSLRRVPLSRDGPDGDRAVSLCPQRDGSSTSVGHGGGRRQGSELSTTQPARPNPGSWQLTALALKSRARYFPLKVYIRLLVYHPVGTLAMRRVAIRPAPAQ
jgi:hypothetical protein